MVRRSPVSCPTATRRVRSGGEAIRAPPHPPTLCALSWRLTAVRARRGARESDLAAAGQANARGCFDWAIPEVR